MDLSSPAICGLKAQGGIQEPLFSGNSAVGAAVGTAITTFVAVAVLSSVAASAFTGLSAITRVSDTPQLSFDLLYSLCNCYCSLVSAMYVLFAACIALRAT
jgi:hypothetical protein